MDGTRIGLFV
jgi:hypothetical protein